NQTYRNITGSMHFDGRVAEIQDVRAYSDGTATLVGVVTFERLTQPVFDLRLTLDGFRPLGVDNQPDAAVDGFVAVGGQLNELHMAGGVRVSDGYFMVPQFGADLAATYGDLNMAAPVLGQDFTPEEQPQWLRNLSIENLRVALGDGVWIKAREATLQLSGELTVNKRQDNYNVLGELEGRRGDYTLIVGPIVRRFDIVSANVRFQGGSEMNPAIDVDARRIIMEGGQRLNVDVHLGGTMRTPTISLASEDVPNIPESELISYLLFGRSSLITGTDITQSGIESFNSEAYEIAGSLVEQAVVGKLGVPLDVFQVRWGPDGPSLVLGRQLSSDFFLTFESGSTGLGGIAGVGSNATTGGMNDWAVRLEWAFADQSSLQLGFEPVRPGSRIRGLGRVLTADNRQQLFAEVRRRWTW
ncbi:MAG TPA: translocation/assembly module TamB domain-containing protein, partial [Longimicrobiales bacterium]